MPTANQAIALQVHDTVSASKTTEPQDMKDYGELHVYFNVDNGSGTPTDYIDLVIQTCDTDSEDDGDWVDLVPDDGIDFSKVYGTGGTPAWPKAQFKKFSGFSQWVRGKLTVNNGDWSTKVSLVARKVN